MLFSLNKTKNFDKDQMAVHYASLHSRLLATMIDLLIASVVLMPLFRLMQFMFYGKNDLHSVVNRIIKEIESSPGQFSRSSDVLHVLITHPHMQHFWQQYGYLFALDIMVQVGVSSIILLWFWCRYQASLGKMLLSLRIVDEKTLGIPTKRQYIIRLMVSILSAVSVIGIMWIVFSSRRQAWHDYAAGTLVIKRARTPKTMSSQ
jgi:uncharacterized RDD family membrane protein YckC